MLQESFVHPFSEQRLLLISTGIAIDQKDSEELLDAFQIGSRSMDAFITDRLSEGSKISIFDPIKKLKLASFNSVSKKKVIKTKTKTVALQFSKDLFYVLMIPFYTIS